LTPVASLVSVHRLRPRSGLVGPVTVWGIMFIWTWHVGVVEH